MKTVKTEWKEIIEYELNFECPNCKGDLFDTNFIFDEGEKIDGVFTCPLCGDDFKLEIEEV